VVPVELGVLGTDSGLRRHALATLQFRVRRANRTLGRGANCPIPCRVGRASRRVLRHAPGSIALKGRRARRGLHGLLLTSCPDFDQARGAVAFTHLNGAHFSIPGHAWWAAARGVARPVERQGRAGVTGWARRRVAFAVVELLVLRAGRVLRQGAGFGLRVEDRRVQARGAIVVHTVFLLEAGPLRTNGALLRYAPFDVRVEVASLGAARWQLIDAHAIVEGFVVRAQGSSVAHTIFAVEEIIVGTQGLLGRDTDIAFDLESRGA
jgi:hypothetical protein